MNYLQKIKVILEEISYAVDFLQLKEALKQDNIILEILRMGELPSLLESIFPGGGPEPGEMLITDSASAARSLVQRGHHVLAFFHDGNRRQDFSRIKYALEKPGELDASYLEEVFRRLTGRPWEILKTARCIIRETTEEDVEAFYAIYKNPMITKYTENLYPEPEQEKRYVREYIEKIYGFYGFGVWTVLERAAGEVIGRAGFSYREGFDAPELGFIIGAPWQRRGMAYEICAAILDYGREKLGFDRVNALVQPENQASLRLCEKLGFQNRETCTLNGQSHLWLEKELIDACVQPTNRAVT